MIHERILRGVLILILLITFIKVLDVDSWKCACIDTHTFIQLTRYYAGYEDRITNLTSECPNFKGYGNNRYKTYVINNNTTLPHLLIGKTTKLLRIPDTTYPLVLFDFVLFLINLYLMYVMTKLIIDSESVALMNVLLLLCYPFTYFNFVFSSLVNQLVIQTIMFLGLYYIIKKYKSESKLSNKIVITILTLLLILCSALVLKKPWKGEWFHPAEGLIDIIRYFYTLKFFVILLASYVTQKLILKQD